MNTEWNQVSGNCMHQSSDIGHRQLRADPRSRGGHLRALLSFDAVVAMLVALALQITFALFLLLHDAPKLAQREADEFRTVLTWVERPLSSFPPVRPPPPIPRSRPNATIGQAERTVSTSPAGEQFVESTTSDDPAPPLVLTLPSNTPPGTFDSHAFGRSKSTPAYVQTRFAKAWTPDGEAVQKTWAHRSRAAQLLLSATGALDLPCTDEEKRLRKPRCAGAQYDGAE